MAKFSTLEDKLLEKYWDQNPGKLFKEVEVGRVKNEKCKQKVDAVLIPQKEKEVYCEHDFNLRELKEEVEGKSVEIIEVKSKLNRAVIGQVEVGKYLMSSNFNCGEISPVIACSDTQAGLRGYCDYKDIEVSVLEEVKTDSENFTPRIDKTNLLMKSPQNLFHTQDLALIWRINNRSTLYNTIKRYVSKGVLSRIHKGFYSKVPLDQVDPVKLGGGYLHTFSYLSTESVLTREGIISQDIPYITLISERSERFNIEDHYYISRQMKDKCLFNETGIIEENGIKKAIVSRAVADMLYYNPDYHFDGPNLIDWDEVEQIQQAVGFKKNGQPQTTTNL